MGNVNYRFTENGVVYDFDDVFVPSEFFNKSSIFLWGYNIYGALGTNNAGVNTRSTPVTTFAGGNNWKSVSSGDQHTAAIKTDGSLWVWGNNGNGQLGINNGAGTVVSTPVTTFAGGNNWKSVSCSGASTMALKTDGTLWAWGSQGIGILGNNNPFVGNVLTPITTFAGGNDWKEISMGNSHAAAIKTDGTLWIWGGNSSGCLGINATGGGSRSTPVTTFAGGNDWKYVSCRLHHTAAIKNDGSLWVWGSNSSALLAGNDAILYDKSTPVTTFLGGNNWKSISNGSSSCAHVMAVKTDGTLWGWGRNLEGQIGINITGISTITPVTTFAGGNNWNSVSCGGFHTLAIKTDGSLWVWGFNSNGQLGLNLDGSTNDRRTPVTTFAGSNTWNTVAGGNYHSAAIKY